MGVFFWICDADVCEFNVQVLKHQIKRVNMSEDENRYMETDKHDSKQLRPENGHSPGRRSGEFHKCWKINHKCETELMWTFSRKVKWQKYTYGFSWDLKLDMKYHKQEHLFEH